MENLREDLNFLRFQDTTIGGLAEPLDGAEVTIKLGGETACEVSDRVHEKLDELVPCKGLRISRLELVYLSAHVLRLEVVELEKLRVLLEAIYETILGDQSILLLVWSLDDTKVPGYEKEFVVLKSETLRLFPELFSLVVLKNSFEFFCDIFTWSEGKLSEFVVLAD